VEVFSIKNFRTKTIAEIFVNQVIWCSVKITYRSRKELWFFWLFDFSWSCHFC